MRRKAAVLVVASAVAATAAVSVATAAHRAAGPKITVKPASGPPTTRFIVSFRTPDRTGQVGVLDRRDELSVQGPSRQAGCVADVSRTLPSAAAHARLITRLDPAQLGGRWCVGAYADGSTRSTGPRA